MGRSLPQIVRDIRYARDRARGIMGRLHLPSAAYAEHTDATSIAKAIASSGKLTSDIRLCVGKLGYAAAGRIASVGVGTYGPPNKPAIKGFPLLKDATPLWEGGWLNEDFPGWLLVLNIATAATIAAMAVNIFEDNQAGVPDSPKDVYLAKVFQCLKGLGYQPRRGRKDDEPRVLVMVGRGRDRYDVRIGVFENQVWATHRIPELPMLPMDKFAPSTVTERFCWQFSMEVYT